MDDAWTKIIVVLAERNWNKITGLIDTPNDQGSNVAAEAGLVFISSIYPSI